MGNSSNQPHSLFINFRHEDWNLYDGSKQFQAIACGNFNTLKNKYTQQKIDRYIVNFNTELDYKNYCHSLVQRIRDQYLVNVLHFDPVISKDLCRSTYSSIVYIQNIPLRLSNISDIPLNQSIYMIRNAILGFHQLYKRMGYFQILEQLICIDQQGQVKVWMNSDLSKNIHSYYSDSEYTLNSQRTMCKQIISIIQKNTGQQDQSNILPFLKFVEKQCKNSPNFKQSLYLLEQYIKINGILVPRYCESVVQIFREEYGDEIFFQTGQITVEEESCKGIGISESEASKGNNYNNHNNTVQFLTDRDNFHQYYHNSTDRSLSSRNNSKKNKQSIRQSLMRDSKSSRNNGYSAQPQKIQYLPFRQKNLNSTNLVSFNQYQSANPDTNRSINNYYHSNNLSRNPSSSSLQPLRIKFTYSGRDQNSNLVSKNIVNSNQNSYLQITSPNYNKFNQIEYKSDLFSGHTYSISKQSAGMVKSPPIPNYLQVIQQVGIDPQILADLQSIIFESNQ